MYEEATDFNAERPVALLVERPERVGDKLEQVESALCSICRAFGLMLVAAIEHR